MIRYHKLQISNLSLCIGLHTSVNVGAESINNLLEVILSNGFPRLRICTAFHIGCFEYNNAWTGSSTLRILNLHLKTTTDSDQLRSVCSQLRQLTTYDSSMGNPREGIYCFFSFLILYKSIYRSRKTYLLI